MMNNRDTLWLWPAKNTEDEQAAENKTKTARPRPLSTWQINPSESKRTDNAVRGAVAGGNVERNEG